jgi:glucokinase
VSKVDSHGSGVVLALDLGGTQIRVALVGDDGSVSHRSNTRTPVSHGPEAIVAACVVALTEVHEQLVRESGGGGPAGVRGIGISAPGPVDPFLGVIVDPPNLGPAFRDIPLAERASEALGLPAFLDRDTQVAAMAERTFGAARGCDDFVYITVSTGCGGAIVSGGRLLRGPDGTAGEIGHLLVDRAGPPCGCGASGHLEAITSGVAMTRAARAAAEDGGGTALAEVIATTGPSFGAREVVAAAATGDPTAAAIVDDACDAFAQACVTLVDLFNPELIVVGGSLAAGLGDRLLAPARETVAAFAFSMAARRVRIVPATLGDDVGLVGASVLVRDRLSVEADEATGAPRAARLRGGR